MSKKQPKAGRDRIGRTSDGERGILVEVLLDEVDIGTESETTTFLDLNIS